MPVRPRGGVVTQRSANSITAVSARPNESRNVLIYLRFAEAKVLLIRSNPGSYHSVR
jgi:hypothetical protein